MKKTIEVEVVKVKVIGKERPQLFLVVKINIFLYEIGLVFEGIDVSFLSLIVFNSYALKLVRYFCIISVF